jgi:hypothetical protein
VWRGRQAGCESLAVLAGDVGDEREVVVDVKHGESGEFGSGRDDRVWDRGARTARLTGWEIGKADLPEHAHITYFLPNRPCEDAAPAPASRD